MPPAGIEIRPTEWAKMRDMALLSSSPVNKVETFYFLVGSICSLHMIVLYIPLGNSADGSRTPPAQAQMQERAHAQKLTSWIDHRVHPQLFYIRCLTPKP